MAGTTVDHVIATNFRNYESFDVSLSPGFNLIVGPNAQGKTNFLEAIYWLSSVRLLRSSKDQDAIRFGEEEARVTAKLGPHGTEIALRVPKGSRKIAYLNGLALPRASDLLGRLPSVCISSIDLALAKGEPAVRRLFLDTELCQRFPSYLHAFTHYKRALDQRNTLLKQAQTSNVTPQTFEPWEDVLATFGSQLRTVRSDYVAALNRHAQEIHSFIGSGELASFAYEWKDANRTPEELLGAFESSRKTDILRGSTTIGPHRDDLRLAINEIDVRAFGSQGQQRTSVISLKLASLVEGTEIHGFIPLLFLDDILSDLDEFRRKHLVEWVLIHAGQAILTCTEPDAAGKELSHRSKLFIVQNGSIGEP